MRKYLITALVAGGLAVGGFVATSAQAEPSGSCAGGQAPHVLAVDDV